MITPKELRAYSRAGAIYNGLKPSPEPQAAKPQSSQNAFQSAQQMFMNRGVADVSWNDALGTYWSFQGFITDLTVEAGDIIDVTSHNDVSRRYIRTPSIIKIKMTLVERLK